MAALGTIATVASLGAAIVGTGLSLAAAQQNAEAAKKAGEADQAAAYYLASQEEAQGREDFAAAQRDAQERTLQGALILSRQQAVAAASGGGAGSDAPTIVRLMTDTAARTRYGEESVIYATGSRRDAAYRSAAARRISGDSSFLGGIQASTGAWLSGFGSLASGIGRVGDIYNNRYGKPA